MTFEKMEEEALNMITILYACGVISVSELNSYIDEIADIAVSREERKQQNL